MNTRGPRRPSASSAADLEWAISLNRKILKILGLWTYSNETKWQTALSNIQTCFFALGILSFIVFPQTLALIKVWGDLTLIVDNLIINLPATTSVLKILVPWWKKKTFASIFNEIESDWLQKKNPNERLVMIKYASIGKIMTVLGMLGASFSLAFYHLPLIFGIVPRTITNLSDQPGSLFPLQSVYLYNTSTPLRYYLTEVSELIGGLCAITAYTGIDVLFAVIVLHACGQLENLSNRIEVMVETANFSKYLRLHVQNHCRLIRFVKTIEQSCSLMLLVLFASVAITICVLGFQLIEVCTNKNLDIPVPQVIFYIQFLSYCMFLMFVYSWVGENLVTQVSSNFFEPITLFNVFNN
uniref:Odorant receptor n=1 Tax=Aulacocentrum confusum TaxID=2767324 RepID=A0A7G8Z978_9HYME|nr:olfactory receptor 59 [Aulacocentrum confusum]